MKVLKPGRKQQGWAKRFTCTGHGNHGGGCGAKLLVQQADVFITTTYSYDDSESFYTFKCVNCGVKTDLPKYTNLPFHPPEEKEWVKKALEITGRPNGE